MFNFQIRRVVDEYKSEAVCNSTYCLMYEFIMDDNCDEYNWDDCQLCPANCIGDKLFFLRKFE